MVLHLKVWKSKSLPGLLTSYFIDAGWSSPVARQAHNLKVVGSNPTPATKIFEISLTISITYTKPLENFRWFFTVFLLNILLL